MTESISIQETRCFNQSGYTGTALGYVSGQGHYRLRLKFTLTKPVSAVHLQLDFERGDTGNDPVFYAGIAASAAGTPPESEVSFGFSSGFGAEVTVARQLLPGTYYLWLFKKDSQTDGAYVQDSRGMSLSATLMGLARVYRSGSWRQALPVVYRSGGWHPLLPRRYDRAEGSWKTLI